MELSAWVDADYAACPYTFRSVLAAAMILGGGVISCFSQAQRVIAVGTFQLTYVALVEWGNELFGMLCS